MGVSRLRLHDINAVSTAQIIPCSSRFQKLRFNSPLTPLQSGLDTSLLVATAAIFLMALEICLQVAVKLRNGWLHKIRRYSPEHAEISLRKVLIGR